jgi:hypothetical protein
LKFTTIPRPRLRHRFRSGDDGSSVKEAKIKAPLSVCLSVSTNLVNLGVKTTTCSFLTSNKKSKKLACIAIAANGKEK